MFYVSLLLTFLSFLLIHKLNFSFFECIVFSLIAGYLPSFLSFDYKKGGRLWPIFQRLTIWKRFAQYFSAEINVEKKLDDQQIYIFCNFPHGACTVNHMLTMTDCCGMLTDIYQGERRDLAASILFMIPLLREFLLFLGCVDASSSTAHYNLKKRRSLLIYIGGEKEQLLTVPNEHKIFLQNRKGFIKLALQYGAHLVPMYVFGENETYSISQWMLPLRLQLQESYQIGIPIFSGRGGTFLPYPVKLGVEIGAPIVVTKLSHENISSEEIDKLHSHFVAEMKRLFNRTKSKYGVTQNELIIL